MIGLEQAVERQQGREQCGDPYHPGSDPLEDRRLGADAQRKQHDRQHKEAEDEAGIAAVAQSEAQVAPEEADKGRHPQTAAALCRDANASSSIPTKEPISIGKWVARTTRPPAARCAAMARSRRF